MAAARFDLVVIGAGAAGLSAARSAAAAGRRVALVERARPGGDCTFTGCVPSKTLLEVSRRVAGSRADREHGVTGELTVDLPRVLAHVREVIESIAGDESPTVLEGEGVHLVTGRARLLGPHQVRVEGNDAVDLVTDQLVLAVGALPTVPPIEGLSEVTALTSETVFELRHTPQRLLVLGGGPIGCELAQAMSRLGVPVVLVQSGPRLLPKDEPAASAVVLEALTAGGADVRLGARVERVSAGGAGAEAVTLHLAGGGAVSGSDLLVCVGRSPDTADLGLDLAGVALDPASHRIEVAATLRTSVPHIWAIGDCAAPLQLTHLADEQGRLAAANAFARKPKPFDDRVIPWVTYTEPEVGRVGLTEAQAYAQYGAAAQVVTVPMTAVDRARCAGQTEGFIQLIAAPRRRVAQLARTKYLLEIVGMTAVCPVGGELVHEAAVLMRAGALAGRVAQTVHAYPSWSLGVRQGAAALFGSGGSPRPARPE